MALEMLTELEDDGFLPRRNLLRATTLSTACGERCELPPHPSLPSVRGEHGGAHGAALVRSSSSWANHLTAPPQAGGTAVASVCVGAAARVHRRLLRMRCGRGRAGGGDDGGGLAGRGSAHACHTRACGDRAAAVRGACGVRVGSGARGTRHGGASLHRVSVRTRTTWSRLRATSTALG
jgi:hypothetical protein